MARLPTAALFLALLLAPACRIEDHTPTGSRRDEDVVQGLVAGYARTLSARDWKGARALFWADASYAGPMIPGPGDAHQAVPIDLAINTIARRVDGLDPSRFDVRILRADYPAGWRSRRRLADHPASHPGRGSRRRRRLGGASRTARGLPASGVS